MTLAHPLFLHGIGNWKHCFVVQCQRMRAHSIPLPSARKVLLLAAIFHYNPDRPFRDSPELYLCYWGKEACAPQHSFGPGVRDVYKIHFVHEERGSFAWRTARR